MKSIQELSQITINQIYTNICLTSLFLQFLFFPFRSQSLVGKIFQVIGCAREGGVVAVFHPQAEISEISADQSTKILRNTFWDTLQQQLLYINHFTFLPVALATQKIDEGEIGPALKVKVLILLLFKGNRLPKRSTTARNAPNPGSSN